MVRKDRLGGIRRKSVASPLERRKFERGTEDQDVYSETGTEEIPTYLPERITSKAGNSRS